MSEILIIDDDQQLNASFSKILSQEGYQTDSAFTGRDGITRALTTSPDLIVLDVRLPDMSGIKVFEEIHAERPMIPIIIITAHENTETAIGAIQKGAYDFIYKPFDIPEMLELIEKGINVARSMSSPIEVNPESETYSGHEAIIGSCKEMLEIYKAIGRVSSTNATVLIRGESGTGKELASRAIYNYSSRVDKPYSVINCVAIPETLLESELFGYEKGSFTGAMQRKVGKIEQARGGTVFLDEVGDMPLAIQAKLLRLLQENSIERIGGKEQIPVDVRIIAATNRDLEQAVRDGSFREDLYYRLRVVTITLPPLRKRKEDIPALVHYLLSKLSQTMGIANPGISQEALKKLSHYDWPGNIRELSNTLKRTLIFNRGAAVQAEEVSFQGELQLEDSSISHEEAIQAWVRTILTSGQHPKAHDFCIDHLTSLLIREALELTGGNRSQAARMLGISRPTLHVKMDKYQLGGQTE